MEGKTPYRLTISFYIGYGSEDKDGHQFSTVCYSVRQFMVLMSLKRKLKEKDPPVDVSRDGKKPQIRARGQ